jgi:hypothetical protein
MRQGNDPRTHCSFQGTDMEATAEKKASLRRQQPAKEEADSAMAEKAGNGKEPQPKPAVYKP